MKKILIGLVALLLSGCCFQEHKQEYYRNLKVQFGENVCNYEKRKLLRNLKRIVDYWEEDFQIHVPDLTIKVLGKKRFKCGKKWATGCYFHYLKQVTVTTGPWNTLPSLYHEFCHAAFATHDINHEHKGWAKWKRRQKEIQRKLRRIL